MAALTRIILGLYSRLYGSLFCSQNFLANYLLEEYYTICVQINQLVIKPAATYIQVNVSRSWKRRRWWPGCFATTSSTQCIAGIRCSPKQRWFSDHVKASKCNWNCAENPISKSTTTRPFLHPHDTIFRIGHSLLHKELAQLQLQLLFNSFLFYLTFIIWWLENIFTYACLA